MANPLLSITFAPLLPWPLLLALSALMLGVAMVGLVNRARGSLFRLLAFGAVILTFAGPRHHQEHRTAQDDIAVVVVDRSPSQLVENRPAQVDEALTTLEHALGKQENLEVRIVEVSNADDGADKGTRLIEALARATADIPAKRFAGAIMITDGQVHDAGGQDGTQNTLTNVPHGPIHTLLSGKKQSFDRRLVIEKAPAYGLVGQPTDITFRIEQTSGPGITFRPVTVTLAIDGKPVGALDVRPGRSTTLQFELDHAGASVVELSAEVADGELSVVNNTGVAAINGVRDRLRVLLVSGQPHAGERTWRNLLKSDPAVDLVHFTILRPPEKSDLTPIRELSLITFPTFELFDLRINEFDLIVFDRYVVRHVLSPRYFRKIGDYLRGGGGIMVAMGPEYAGFRSLYETPLGPLLPSQPTGTIVEQGFRPHLTDEGLRHPVTNGLKGGPASDADTPVWGRWFRQIETISRSGTVLMQGVATRPLLTLDRVGDGRIGMLTSDQIWLWARGYEGGGPQAELLRRLAHWLMKEPALEEERLGVTLKDGALHIMRRTLGTPPSEVSVTTPTGKTVDVTLEPVSPGRAVGLYRPDTPGVYRVEDGDLVTQAAFGSLNPVEYRDLRATDEILGPLSARTGGGVFWLSDKIPEARRVKAAHKTTGAAWIGLRANRSYVVSGVADVALLPWWLGVGLIMAFLFAAWWREGR